MHASRHDVTMRASERTRDAKGDVKLETKRIDAERRGGAKRTRERGIRIDVTFVNLSGKDTEVRGGGWKSEKRKVLARVCHSLNRLLSADYGPRCIPLHALAARTRVPFPRSHYLY